MFIFLTIAGPSRAGLWRRAPLLLTLAWVALIALATLRPDPGALEAVARSPWWCVSCGEAGTADLLINVALFAPLGWGMARSGIRHQPALLLALALTVFIEFTQGWALPGRDAALGDVLANVAGAALGFLAAGALSPPRPAWVSHVVLAGFVAQLLVSWWFWSPATTTAVRSLRIAPEMEGRPVYLGRVTGIGLTGEVLQGELSHAASATLAAAFTWIPAAADRSTPIVRVEDGRGWPVATVSMRRDRVSVSVRTIAGALQFRDPNWSITAEGVPADAPLEVALREVRGAGELTATWPGGSHERAVRRGPQHGWVFLNPYAPGVGDRGWLPWTLAWLAGWGALLGWAARGRRPLATGTAALLVFLLICAVAGAPAGLAELAALAAGWLLALSSGRSPRRPVAA